MNRNVQAGPEPQCNCPLFGNAICDSRLSVLAISSEDGGPPFENR